MKKHMVLAVFVALSIVAINSARSVADTGTVSVDSLNQFATTQQPSDIKDLYCTPKKPETTATKAQQQEILSLAKKVEDEENSTPSYSASSIVINEAVQNYYAAIAKYDTCVPEKVQQ